MSAFRVRDFAPGDEADLQRLLAECPEGNSIRYVPLRPSGYVAFARLLGDRATVLVCEDAATGALAGTLTYAWSETRVAKEPRTVAYIGDLKTSPSRRGRGVSDLLMLEASRRLRALEPRTGPLPVLIAVTDENRIMHDRKVADFRRVGAFDWRPFRRLSFAVHVPRAERAAPSGEWSVSIAGPGDRETILGLWERRLDTRSFARSFGASEWDSPDASFPGLRPEHFLLLHRRSLGPVGFAAVWDPSMVREAHALEISPALRFARPILAGDWARRLGLPKVPVPGERLKMAHILHWCVPDDAVEGAAALLGSARSLARQIGVDLLVAGVDSEDPARRSIEKGGLLRAGATIYLDPRGTNLFELREGACFQAESALG